MNKKLGLGAVESPDWYAAQEEFWKNNWTDGLPVIPATEQRVTEFLDYVRLEPDVVIGEVAERDASINAEMIAVNAVMAGCLPEYMPILIAAVKAVTDHEFHFNHLASMGSPWPLLIVNGPITKQLKMNSGLYVLGPGNRPNATIGRAMSLIMWNSMDAKPGGILRGCMGHPGRWAFCIAENEDTPWEPVHVLQGFDRNTSTVTAFPSSDGGRRMGTYYREPKAALDAVGYNVAACEMVRGVFCVLVNPYLAEQVFAKEGWTKKAAQDYLVENCRMSVRDLKTISRWGWWGDYVAKDPPPVQPGDEDHYIYQFRDPPGQEKYTDLVFPSTMNERRRGVMLVVAGGNASNLLYILRPYTVSANPVTQAIEIPK
ncbi:MAG: hypothetical protein HYY32_04315 [Chloroflexi bacterium]|nr:hypothetical protein [Chloroflexota bacterium]